MSMTLRALPVLSLLSLLALGGCSEPSRPPSGVDLATPVRGLAGWDALVADLGLTDPQEDTFADWVEVFRSGLDASRRADDPVASEQNWWTEAERSLAVIVGDANVPAALAWLEARFERRGRTS